MEALYVHIPFCETKCSYCDFFSLPGGRRGREPEAYLSALRRELAHRAPAGFRPRTIFVGGGTPTVLTPGELRDLGALLRDTVDLSAVEEWSVEANPGTLRPATLDALLAIGVDRLSVGVQSFDDAVLRSVGRIHTAAQARAAVRCALDAGMPRVSVDLLFAIPGQGEETFHRDLDTALDLGTGHLSCYALLYEEGTALHRRAGRGLVRREEEDAEVRMLRHARRRLADAGFRAYEISNFARPGEECRHNLVYWRNEPYLGIGVAATSYVDGERSSAVRDLRAYIDRVEAGGEAAVERERLDPAAALGETLMLGLRTDEGLSLRGLVARHGSAVTPALEDGIRALAGRGLLEFDGDRFRVTDLGIPVADGVAVELMP